MMLIPTTYYVKDETAGVHGENPPPMEIRITIDADKVCLWIDGGQGQTGIVFDNGNHMTINYPFELLMRYLAEQNDGGDT